MKIVIEKVRNGYIVDLQIESVLVGDAMRMELGKRCCESGRDVECAVAAILAAWDADMKYPKEAA